jgi:hypothetical protein
MHQFGYDVGIVGKIVKKTFAVTVKVIYLEYIEITTPNCRVLCILTG